MFGALGRFFRKLGYLLTGRLDKLSDELEADPIVIKATAGKIVKKQKEEIDEFLDAVGGKEHIRLTKMDELGKLTNAIVALERQVAGGEAMARQYVAQLKKKGMKTAEIEQDAKYMEIVGGINDATTTLAAKQKHLIEVEGDIKRLGEEIKKHEKTLVRLKENISKIKEKAADTAAAIIAAGLEERLNKVIAGISTDTTGQELERWDEMRNKALSRARLSSVAAGTEVNQLQEEFIKYASQTAMDKDFRKRIGLDDEEEEKPAEVTTAEEGPVEKSSGTFPKS